MKTEKQKMLAGEFFASQNPEIERDAIDCQRAVFEFNSSPARPGKEKNKKLAAIFGAVKNTPAIMSPFYCDYGYNIYIGKNFFANYGLTILDSGKVTIGDNVMIGPNCGIYTPNHPLNADERLNNEEIGLPVSIGDNVWIGGNVVVLPGVYIGDNAVIGAGSVVTKNIPPYSLAVGNPCKVIKKLRTEQ